MPLNKKIYFYILVLLFSSLTAAKEFRYDALGRLESIVDGDINISYDYDSAGNRRQVVIELPPPIIKPTITPTITMSWSGPTQTLFGKKYTLIWSTKDAVQCSGTILHLNKSLAGTSGNVTISDPPYSLIARLTCSNQNSSTLKSAYIYVNDTCPPNSICLPSTEY